MQKLFSAHLAMEAKYRQPTSRTFSKQTIRPKLLVCSGSIQPRSLYVHAYELSLKLMEILVNYKILDGTCQSRSSSVDQIVFPQKFA